ncbi:hypothetical protein H5024_12870 [Ochrobactrum sp. Marseille-Q0166]|nr:hypothetical protein [Ochrobactrum sp. Marseille-Q0166]
MDQIPQIDKCIVNRCKNKGRDVASWVILFKDEIIKYDIFIHAHSKKSNYQSRYQFWRKFLLHNTLGSEGIFSQIYNIFESDASIGLFYPAYYGETSLQPSWGSNKTAVDQLSKRIIGIPELNTCPDFPGGPFSGAELVCLSPCWTQVYAMKILMKKKGR